jgi:hypothetical protein
LLARDAYVDAVLGVRPVPAAFPIREFLGSKPLKQP